MYLNDEDFADEDEDEEEVDPDAFVPPDGGYGWMVALGAFIALFWGAGLVKSYGVLFDEILKAKDYAVYRQENHYSYGYYILRPFPTLLKAWPAGSRRPWSPSPWRWPRSPPPSASASIAGELVVPLSQLGEIC